MEILQTIVLLCQINGSARNIEESQLKCQKYYTTCLSNNNLASYRDLSKCIQERKL